MKITPAAVVFIASLSKAATALPADWKINPDPENNPSTYSADFTKDSTTPGIASAHSATTPTLTSGNANLKTFLLDGGCVPITSDAATQMGMCSVDGSVSLSTSCAYPISLGSISTRSGYVPSDTTSDDKPTLTACEVVQLSYKDSTAEMVIAETYTNIKVKFENTKTFTTSSISLEKADIKSAATDTSLEGYITATNCGTTIGPNDVLCILITSSSGDVLIKRIDTMTINGNDDTFTNTLVVYEENVGIKYSAITEEFNNPDTTEPTRQAVKVETRVPSNVFNFEKDGAQVTVAGTVTVEFAGERRLIALDRLLQENGPETAAFDLTVNLARGPELDLEGGEAMMSSAKVATAGKAFAILGMVFASAFSLW